MADPRFARVAQDPRFKVSNSLFRSSQVFFIHHKNNISTFIPNVMLITKRNVTKKPKIKETIGLIILGFCFRIANSSINFHMYSVIHYLLNAN